MSRYPISSPPHSSTAYTRAYYARGKLSQIASRKVLFISTFVAPLQSALHAAHRAPGTAPGTTALPAARLTQHTAPGTAPGTAQRAATRSAARAAARSTRLFTLLFTALLTAFFCTFTVSSSAFAYAPCQTQLNTISEYDLRPRSDLQFDDGGWTNDVIPQVFTLGELSTAFGHEQAFGLSDYIPHVNKQNMYETLTEEDLKHGIAPTMKIDRQNMTVQTYALSLQGYDKEWRNGTKVSALIYYGYIGTYRGVPIRGRLFVDGEYQKVWKNLDKPYMQVASKFIGGIALFNVKNVRISYQIDPVMTDNEAYYMLEYSDRSFVTISSLAYRQSYSPTYSINNINLPFNKVPSDMAILHHSVRKVEYMNDAGFNSTEIDRSEWDQPTRNESFRARCKVLYPSAEKGSDNPRDPGFKKRSFTAYCSSMFLGTLFPYVEWVNLSSAHVGRQATVAPLIKSSKTAQIQTLDQVEFDLEQKVDSLGFTTFNRFNEMELKFEIPREVQCQSIEMLQGVQGFNAPLDKKAGTLVHNKETNTITFTFNKEWLQKTMPLRGEKYIIHVKGRVISPSKKSSARKENKAENPYKTLELKASCKTYGDPVTSTKTLTRAPNDKKSIPIETLEPAQYHEATPVPKANHGALVGVSLSANPQAGSYIQPKERITYTLDVTNNALTAQNCTITMPLPKHMHYIETLQTGNPQVQQTRKASTLEWNLKNLEPGSHTKLNFVAESDADCAVYGSKLFTQASYTFAPAVVKGETKPKNQAQAHSSATATTTATGTASATGAAGATSSAGATGAASAQSAPSNASAVYYSNPLVHTTKQNDKAAPCIDVTLTSNKKAGAALKADEAITYTIQVKDLMNASAQKEKSSVYVVVPLGTRLDNAEIIALPKNAAGAQKAFYDVANHCIQWDISELSPGQTLSLSYKAHALRYPTSAPINQQALFTVHNALHNTNEIQYSNALLHNALSGSFLQNGVSAGTQTDTTITGDMKVPGVSSGTQTDAAAPGVSSGTQTDTTITGGMKVPGVSSGTQTDAPAPGVASGTQTDTSTGVSSETQTEPSTGVSTETQTEPSTGVASGTQTDSSSGVETGTQTNPSAGVSIDTQTDTPSGTTSTSGNGTNPQAGTTGGTSTPDSTSTPTGTHNTGNDAGGSTNSQGPQSHGKKPPKQHGQTPSETTPHKNENGNNTGNSNGSTSGNGTGQGTGNGSSTSNASGNNTSSTSTSTTSGTQGTTSSTNTTPGGSQNQGTTSQNDQNHPSTSAPETPDKIPNASKLLYPLAPENRWYVDFKAAAKLLSNYLDLRPETLSQVWHSIRNGKSDQSTPHQPNGKDTPGKQGEQNTLHPTVEQVLEHLANASEKDIFSSLFPQHNTQTASGSGTGAGQQSDTSHQPGTGTTSGTSTGTNTGTGTSVGTGTNMGTGTTGSGAGAGASTGTGTNTNSGAGAGASTGTNTGAGTNAQAGTTSGNAANVNNGSSHANAGTPGNAGANAGTDTGTNVGTGTDMGTGATGSGAGTGTSTGTGATGANTNSGTGTGASTGANGAGASTSQSQNNASTSTNAQNGSALGTSSHNNTAQNGNANGSATSENASNPSLSHANASGNSAGANQSNNAGNAVNAANNANGNTNGANGNSTSANGLSNGNVGNAGSAANPGSNGITGNADNKKSLPTFALSAGNSLFEESDAQEEQRGGGEKHRSQRLRKAHTEKNQKFKGFNGDNGTKIAKNLLKHKLFPQTGSSIVPFVLLSLTLLLSGAFCFIYATRSTLKERFGYGYSQQEKEITIPRA